MNFAAEGYDWQVIHGKLLDNFEKKINMYSKNQKIPSVKVREIKLSSRIYGPLGPKCADQSGQFDLGID